MTLDRSRQRAQEEALWLPLPQVVSQLWEILGTRLVAYIGGEKSTSSLLGWVKGSAEPSELDCQRLRHAFHAVLLLQERFDSAAIQTWFKCMNPLLNDEAPAQALRDGKPLTAGRGVIEAATSFVSEIGNGLNIRDVTARLIVGLGPTLVAAMAGATSAKDPDGWATYDGPEPSREEAKRLVFAYEQWRSVAGAEGEAVARLWFVGANPWLEDDPPVHAICQGRTSQVRYAVKALINDVWSG